MHVIYLYKKFGECNSTRTVSSLVDDQKMALCLIGIRLRGLQHRYRERKYREVRILAQTKAQQTGRILFSAKALWPAATTSQSPRLSAVKCRLQMNLGRVLPSPMSSLVTCVMGKLGIILPPGQIWLVPH